MDADRALNEILALCHLMGPAVRERVEGAARDLYAEIARRDEAHRQRAQTAVLALEQVVELLEADGVESGAKALADCRAAIGVLRG